MLRQGSRQATRAKGRHRENTEDYGKAAEKASGVYGKAAESYGRLRENGRKGIQ
jgi:hypothetical protein